MVRDGLGAKDVAHSERLGVSWKVADVATVAEVYSPGPHAMMGMKELPARRRTDNDGDDDIYIMMKCLSVCHEK